MQHRCILEGDDLKGQTQRKRKDGPTTGTRGERGNVYTCARIGKTREREKRMAVDDSTRQRRKSRAPRKINTGYVSGGVYTRAPRA